MTVVVAEPRTRLLTIDEFMAMPDSIGFELVEGTLVERKGMGALSDYVAQRVARQLGNFCDASGAGHVFGSETMYRCFAHPNTGRRADASFIAKGRLPGERIPEGYIDIPADLAVEVVSPNDLAYEVDEKVTQYLNHGFGEVWVIYPNTRTMHVHRKGEPIPLLEGDQQVRGSGPLAGFACVLRDLFPDQAPAEAPPVES